MKWNQGLKAGAWIMKIIVAVIIASLLSIWTTSYIVTSYVKQILEVYEFPLEVKQASIIEVWKSLWNTEQPLERELAIEDRMLDPSVNNTTADDSIDTKPAPPSTEDNDNNQPITEPLQEEWNQPASEVLAPLEPDQESENSSEAQSTSKNEMEPEEKESAFAMLMSKLPTDAWQMISISMEDGLTEEELLEVQQVMALHLSKDEYEELLSILKVE